MSAPKEKTSSLQLEPLDLAAGATAAVIAAFAASFLGVAGTVVGTALGSVVTSVSAALVRTSAERTNDRFQQSNVRLRNALRQRVGTGAFVAIANRWPGENQATADSAPGNTDDTDTDHRTAGPADSAGSRESGGTSGSAETDEPGEPSDPGGTFWTRKRLLVIGGGSLIAFVVGLVAVTGIESALGKPLSALLGKNSDRGTTIGHVVTGGNTVTIRPRKPTPGGTSTAVPTSPSAGQSPNGSPTGSPAPSPSSVATTPAPSPAPTGQPLSTQPAAAGTPSRTP